ncbi:hypothetical protein LCGC14_0796300 [marine sediment metagenome]|uniref:Uncharacterized protein n=1 Tax=marine sediment metagenome TaxID=412755 RepID=A0A0F9SB00_9ZZZZ
MGIKTETREIDIIDVTVSEAMDKACELLQELKTAGHYYYYSSVLIYPHNSKKNTCSVRVIGSWRED